MTVYHCFPGGKFKVLTLSYDDGARHDKRLVEILNKYGLRGTFNLNSGHLNREDRIHPDEIEELYKGHEVAVHTYSHPTLERCPGYEIIEEIVKDRRELEYITGYPVRGMAYPNGSYNDEIIRILPSLGIEYGRVVGDTDDFNLPKNYFTWKPTCHHNHCLMQNAVRFVDAVKSQYLYLMYVWGHSYEFAMDNNWEVIEEFAEYTGGRNDIWYAANIEIVDYMNLLKNLKFTADGTRVYNPSAGSAWLSVDGEITEIPGGRTIILQK